MLYVDPPFELGSTLDGTAEDGTTLINKEVCGKIFEIPYQPLGVTSIRGQKKRYTGRSVVAVALRNESGGTLYGKRLAQLTETAGYYLLESVDGYAEDLGQRHVVLIDEFLATTGVPDDDIFWGILKGPHTILTNTANYTADVAVGQPMYAATYNGTSGNSAAGRPQVFPQASSLAQWDTMIGYAMSAILTNSTGEDMLINMAIRY